MRWTEFLDRYFRVRKCSGCGKILPFDDCYASFCSDCRGKWNRAKIETCPECFQSVAECRCSPKLLQDVGVHTLRKLVFYVSKRDHEPQNRSIYAIKKRHNQRIFSFFATELKPMVEQTLIEAKLADPKAEAVFTYIPRSKPSRATYGFDQSELLCRYLSTATEIPYVCALRRVGKNKVQKTLSKQDRLKNMKKMIAITDAEGVRGKFVFLVDDVVTTGASMSACAAALKKAGAACVVGISIAYTPR